MLDEAVRDKEAAAWRWFRQRGMLLVNEDGQACIIAITELEELPPEIAAHLENGSYEPPNAEAILDRVVHHMIAQAQDGGPG